MVKMTVHNKVPKLKLFLDILRDPDRKPMVTILSELFSLSLYYRKFPRHYFSRYLFKKGKTNIKDYFPDDFLYYGIKPKLNDKEWRDVLENKLFFQLYYDQFKVCLPKIILYNQKTAFFCNEKLTKVSNFEDFIRLLTSLFEDDHSRDSLIIKKIYWSYGGDKVFKICRHQLSNGDPLLTEVYSEVITSGFLFQETVAQHEELNKLNPFCLNTLRIDTFIDKEGKIDIISGYIRMSLNRQYVDNISSGGCQVGIDMLTGRLKSEGYSTLSDYGVKILKSHPITETVFEDVVIPFFEEAKAMVLEAASLVPCLRIVGWDVAIAESGPVLIEGNSDYGMTGNDLSTGGYRTNPTFRKVLDEIKDM